MSTPFHTMADVGIGLRKVLKGVLRLGNQILLTGQGVQIHDPYGKDYYGNLTVMFDVRITGVLGEPTIIEKPIQAMWPVDNSIKNTHKDIEVTYRTPYTFESEVRFLANYGIGSEKLSSLAYKTMVDFGRICHSSESQFLQFENGINCTKISKPVCDNGHFTDSELENVFRGSRTLSFNAIIETTDNVMTIAQTEQQLKFL